ncbi:meprin A subunit beta [Fundulus heteroclitus]|uniref:meprin A subunit beta n=1 Tax=Fundulus heteroclitus TaxID=8078 RepID=UPI00165C3D29|nr:meprin A subunit beta [Fundulus heteroclitus]
MQGSIFLMVILVVSSTLSMDTEDENIGEIDDNKNNTNDEDTRKPPISARSSTLARDYRWTSPIPYVLDKSLDLNTKGVIMRAFDQFRLKSCIDFKPRDSEEYYINFLGYYGCWSYIGRLVANGQDISIRPYCDDIGSIEHLIFHILGFYHEELRYDRDDYVQIDFDKVIPDYKTDFAKVSSDLSTTNGVPYDYLSVMHSGKDFLRYNYKDRTIITKDSKFQDVIGQRLEMSPRDAEELNLLYKCNSTVAFLFFCDFSNGNICNMSQINKCTQKGNGWEVVRQACRGLMSDHTTLPGKNEDYGQEIGYFLHASLASGQEGDSAWLRTQIMSTKRECKVQCLQFYYFHSGNELDELNIWIREFQDEQDTTGTLRLMGQITGPPTYHWQLHHVSLNATKNFQVVFQAWKGDRNSTGSFSIDDINLSETECPHVTLQIDDFEKLLSTSAFGTTIYSPRQYSKEGYSYRIGVKLYKESVGMFVQLLSGENDDQLKWPCLQKQMTLQVLDQNPSVQKQMSKQRSFVTRNLWYRIVTSWWGNPYYHGRVVLVENGEKLYGLFRIGYFPFVTLEELETREFLKGGSVIFTFSFEDLTPLVNGDILPCSQVRALNIRQHSINFKEALCLKTDEGISGISPGLVASPILTLLLAGIALLP